MNFWARWFLLKLLSRPIIRSVDWNTDDIRDFDLFSRTRCGIRLFEFLRQVVATQTFNSVYQNSVSKNAEARGAQNVLAILHRLRVFPEQEESSFSDLDFGQPEPARMRGADSKAENWRMPGGRGAIG